MCCPADGRPAAVTAVSHIMCAAEAGRHILMREVIIPNNIIIFTLLTSRGGNLTDIVMETSQKVTTETCCPAGGGDANSDRGGPA